MYAQLPINVSDLWQYANTYGCEEHIFGHIKNTYIVGLDISLDLTVGYYWSWIKLKLSFLGFFTEMVDDS